MCLILDANRYSDFINKDNEDMKPIRKWLDRGGKLVYSPTDKFKWEIRCKGMAEDLEYYRGIGKVKYVEKERVEEEQRKLMGLRSDDEHIIALAIVAKVSLLVSSDKNLHEDFKNLCGGSIYQNRSHQHLLTPDLCP